MRRFLLSMGAVLFLAAPALAQTNPKITSSTGHEYDTPKVEVFAGYSLLRINGQNTHGANVSITGNVNNYFGITGDFSVHTPEDDDDVSIEAVRPPNNDTIGVIMGGPQFKYRRGPVTPFVHALFGGIFGGGDEEGALALGGGLDIRVSDRVAIRAIQAEYFATTERSNNGRFSFGLVFNIGHKEGGAGH